MPETKTAPKRSRSLSAFVYRTLAWRVLLASLLIALAFGLLIYFGQSRNIGQNVVEDALNRLDLLVYHTRQLAEQQGAVGTHFDPHLIDMFATLAPALYREFSDQEGEPLRAALAAITRKYFSAGIETLTY
jgi:hypothetical protein